MIRSLDGIAPKIHPTAFVSEAAYVIGDVVIGEGSSVWPGSVVRGDMGRITIGKYTCVQDNSVVHCDTDASIGDYVVIGHRVVCHAKNVGTRSLLGNGSVVNDGVWIGDECVIASGAVVLDDMQVPERSIVVGVPGRIRGEVQDRHLELGDYFSGVYVLKTQRYLRNGGLGS